MNLHDRACGGAASGGNASGGAFTLIEILVVLVIIAVLAGMIVPQLGGAARALRLREAAKGLYRTAQYAQNYAVTRRTRCRILIDAQNRAYALQVQPAPGSAPAPGSSPDPVADGTWQQSTDPLMAHPKQLPETITFGRVGLEQPPTPESTGDSVFTTSDSRDKAIVFEPDGSATAALVELTDTQETWTLRVAPTTGRPDLTRGGNLDPLHDRTDLDLGP